MQSLELNLSSRPFRNNRLIWWAYALGLVALVGITYGNVNRYLEYRDRYTAQTANRTGFEDRMTLLKQRLSRADGARKQFDVGVLQVRADKANEVIEWKAFSWTRLFNRLESVQPWNVLMTEIKPVFRSAGARAAASTDLAGGGATVPVLVEGVAKDLKGLLAFQRALYDNPWFDDPEPDRFDTTDTNEIQFTMRFYYYPNREEPAPEPSDKETRAEAASGDGEATPAEDAAEPEPTGDDAETVATLGTAEAARTPDPTPEGEAR